MAESGKANQYLNEQNVEILYFSMDTDAERWEKAIREDGVDNSNQYMCYENRKSPLCKYIQIQGIPRYLLFDKQHKLFMLNAPRPIENEFFRLKKAIENVLIK